MDHPGLISDTTSRKDGSRLILTRDLGFVNDFIATTQTLRKTPSLPSGYSPGRNGRYMSILYEKMTAEDRRIDEAVYRKMVTNRFLRRLVPHLVARGEIDGMVVKVFRLHGSPFVPKTRDEWARMAKLQALIMTTMWRHGMHYTQDQEHRSVPMTIPALISYHAIRRFSPHLRPYLTTTMAPVVDGLMTSEIPPADALATIPRTWRAIVDGCMADPPAMWPPGSEAPCQRSHLPARPPMEVRWSNQLMAHVRGKRSREAVDVDPRSQWEAEEDAEAEAAANAQTAKAQTAKAQTATDPPRAPFTVQGGIKPGAKPFSFTPSKTPFTVGRNVSGKPPKPVPSFGAPLGKGGFVFGATTQQRKKIFNETRKLNQTGQLGGARVTMMKSINQTLGKNQEAVMNKIIGEKTGVPDGIPPEIHETGRRMMEMRAAGTLPKEYDEVLDNYLRMIGAAGGAAGGAATGGAAAGATTGATAGGAATGGAQATTATTTSNANEAADAAQRRLIEAVEAGDEDAVKAILGGKFATYQQSLLSKLQEALKKKDMGAVKEVLSEEAKSRRYEAVVPKLVDTLMRGSRENAMSLLGDEKYKQEVEAILPDLLNQVEEGDIDGARQGLQKHMRRLERLDVKRKKRKGGGGLFGVGGGGGGGGFSMGISLRGMTFETPAEQWVRRQH